MPIFKKKTVAKPATTTTTTATTAAASSVAPAHAPLEHPHVKYDKFETIDGIYKTTLPDKIKNKPKWERPDPRKILAFIPGTITSIDVKVGDEVKEGDKLLMFKAMKMSNTYMSPLTGKIATIHVKIDEIVHKGQILLEFE